jgi:hypothetical protein
VRSKSEQLAETRVAVTCPVPDVEREDDGPAMAVDDPLLLSSSSKTIGLLIEVGWAKVNFGSE